MGRGLLAIVLVCVGTVVASLVTLVRYEMTPCELAAAPRMLSPELKRKLGDIENGTSLVAFIHPRCPCSVATIAELERLVAEFPSTVSVAICFYLPGDADQNWVQTNCWYRAMSLPQCRVILDRDAQLTASFHIVTSGHVLLYRDARLVYSGGITSSRGHEGDNEGAGRIVELVHGRAEGYSEYPVYGCVIRSQS